MARCRNPVAIQVRLSDRARKTRSRGEVVRRGGGEEERGVIWGQGIYQIHQKHADFVNRSTHNVAVTRGNDSPRRFPGVRNLISRSRRTRLSSRIDADVESHSIRHFLNGAETHRMMKLRTLCTSTKTRCSNNIPAIAKFIISAALKTRNGLRTPFLSRFANTKHVDMKRVANSNGISDKIGNDDSDDAAKYEE
jgi:hypothetical protein